MLRSKRVGCFAWMLTVGLVAGCQPTKPVTSPGVASAPVISFTDATAEAGIAFRHSNGATGRKLMPETVGSGAAWLDYDGDGQQDLLFVNSGPLPGSKTTSKPTAALYWNRGDGTFEDRTKGSGLDVVLYGQGVCAADYDGDGDPDIFITCVGPNRLFRNEGAGRFTDVTRAAGLGSSEPWRWHTGAVWVDYDKDGKLDLMVARYVKWTPETDQFCGVPGGTKRYCPPNKYEGDRCALYRNLGAGKFADVSAATGIGSVIGKWFQPIACDSNHDGWPDLIVTSDGTPTALFENQQGRRFRDTAAENGLGLSESGMSKSGMGIDVADWRNDGRESVLIGNFSGERLSLYEPDASGGFADGADRVGMGTSSLHSLTFGVAFLDMDLDGWKDALVANGHIDDYIDLHDANVTYRQRPLLYRNQRGASFREEGLSAGAALAAKLVARGCAVADYDGDGDLDFVLTENGGPARLYRNGSKGGNWIRVRAIDKRGGDVVGAVVTVQAGTTSQKASVRAGGQFLSQSELALTFGIGSASTATVTVKWPGGASVTMEATANRAISIRQ